VLKISKIEATRPDFANVRIRKGFGCGWVGELPAYNAQNSPKKWANMLTNAPKSCVARLRRSRWAS